MGYLVFFFIRAIKFLVPKISLPILQLFSCYIVLYFLDCSRSDWLLSASKDGSNKSKTWSSCEKLAKNSKWQQVPLLLYAKFSPKQELSLYWILTSIVIFRGFTGGRCVTPFSPSHFPFYKHLILWNRES